jgi:predicted TIM-barrel fold metal-dependent hydrolase
MYSASPASNRQMLRGLRPKGNAGKAAYGMAMANAAQSNMDRQKQNQQFGMQQMSDASSMRSKAAQQNATNLANRKTEETRRIGMGMQAQMNNAQLNNQYRLANAQRNQRLRQSIFDNFMRQM